MLITPNNFEQKNIDQDYLESLISNKIEENDQLDYKIEVTDNNAEIAKDISSFANTNGGNIIYGIEEEKNKPIRIAPIRIVGLRERLDQITHNGIDPPLNIKIWPVDVDIGGESGQVYILYIPKKYPLLHFAKKNKRYYKRTNFTSTPMEKPEIDLAYKLKLQNEEKINQKLKEIEKDFLDETGKHHYKFIFTIYPLQLGGNLFKISEDMNHFFLENFPKTPINKENLFLKRSSIDLPIFRQDGYNFKSEMGYHNADCQIRQDGIIIYILHFRNYSVDQLKTLPIRNLGVMNPFERLKRGITTPSDKILDKEFFIDYLLGLIDFLYEFYTFLGYYGDINLCMKITGAIQEWTELITGNRFRQKKVEPIEYEFNVEMIPEIRIEIVKAIFNPLLNGFGIMDSDLKSYYIELDMKLRRKL